jgi:citrate synthase
LAALTAAPPPDLAAPSLADALDGLKRGLRARARAGTEAADLLRVLPPAISPMDVVRTSVSVLAHYDPETEIVILKLRCSSKPLSGSGVFRHAAIASTKYKYRHVMQ